MGASLASDKVYHNLTNAYNLLMEAMELRYSDSKDPILKKQVNVPNPVYDSWTEMESIPDLQEIRNNHYALYMEALTIRERILGKKHPDLIKGIAACGEYLAEMGKFSKWMNLWIYAIELRLKHNVRKLRKFRININNELMKFILFSTFII